jgi:arylsulfatase A-like enzyme
MSTRSETDAPNVVVIYTDDQPQEWVGCYGGNVATPNIDRLAEEGVRFDRYYVSSPVCAPSRYSAVSGRYARRSQQFHETCPPGDPVNIAWEPGIAGDDENVATVLRDAGYRTGFVGKWHQGGLDGVEPVPDDADPEDPDVARTVRENYDVLTETIRDSGFDEVYSAYFANVFSAGVPEGLQRHNMEWVTEGAQNFLRANHGDPFFLYLAPTLTHDPWKRSQVEADPRITPAGVLDDAADAQPDRADVLGRVHGSAAASRDPTDAEQAAFMTRESVQLGRAFATWLDDGVGTVLDTLADLGVADNTVVVFTSDHGNRGKLTCYDAGARQPCLVRWPGAVDPGTSCDRLVSNVDLAPTLFDIAGVDPGPQYTVDGQSFLPVLTGEGAYRREDLFLEITTERAVVTDDGYKYIAVRFPPEIQSAVDDGARYQHSGDPAGEHLDRFMTRHDLDVRYGAGEDFPGYFDDDQLYDLVADPAEQHNLADDPDYRSRLDALRDRLRDYCAGLPHEFGEFTA